MFTKQEIELLKKYLNIIGFARKHNISTKSNYIYKLLRKEVVDENTKGYKVLLELEKELIKLKKEHGLV